MDKNKHIITDSSGNSKIFGLILILIVVSAIYLSYMILPHYLHYYSFRDIAQAKTKMAKVTKDEGILNDLYKKAKELDLPLERGDIIIKRGDVGGLIITAQWEIEVEFIGGYKKNLQFIVDTSN
ncbi:MAG: hypothetical protein HZA06_01420 [Nitrospirae bacterium]|nr:hypothetical protein [Nitrospirota bacterium]